MAGKDGTAPLCGLTFDDVTVVTGFGADVAVFVVGGRVGCGLFEICWGAGVNFVSDTFGIVVVNLLVEIAVGANVEGGDDFVGDSKVTQGSGLTNFEFFICSDK